MQALRLRRHLCLWLAIAAMLMAALAPAVSQAVRVADPVAWAEVCSSTAQAGKGVPGDVAHLFEHCPYCSLHQPATGLPAPDASLPMPAPSGETLPELCLHGPVGPLPWAAARPRGPPTALV
jgi:hypothetical protein